MAITSLENLILSHNDLGGNLPHWVTDDFSPNHLSEYEFESTTTNLIQPPIRVLDLSYNQIYGGMSILFLLRSYEILDLSFNEVDGNIPDAIRFLGNLRTLHLNNNTLSGDVPNMMSLVQLRKYFFFWSFPGSNHLAWPFPDSLQYHWQSLP